MQRYRMRDYLNNLKETIETKNIVNKTLALLNENEIKTRLKKIHNIEILENSTSLKDYLTKQNKLKDSFINDIVSNVIEVKLANGEKIFFSTINNVNKFKLNIRNRIFVFNIPKIKLKHVFEFLLRNNSILNKDDIINKFVYGDLVDIKLINGAIGIGRINGFVYKNFEFYYKIEGFDGIYSEMILSKNKNFKKFMKRSFK